mgnify:CR=1 FL=1
MMGLKLPRWKYLVDNESDVIELPRKYLEDFRKKLKFVVKTPAGQKIYRWGRYWVLEWRSGDYSIFDEEGIHVCNINLPNWNTIEIIF